MEDKKERVFGLIGYPLGHSFSQAFFTQKFADENINARYQNFELTDIGFLLEAIAEQPRLSGFNVTIPYKEQVIPFLSELDPMVEAIGAVNVVKLIRDEQGNLTLKGYNSDVVGFMDSLRPLLRPHHKRALVLGTGGAAKAVAYGLRCLGIEPVYVSRHSRQDCLTYDRLSPDLMASHTVIVNTTPLGMHPNIATCPSIPYELITSDHLCYDLHYNPAITQFMERSAAQGATVKNGHEMLIGQALESWRIWNE